MTLATAQLLVHVLGAYTAAGALFAALFLWRGVGRLDPAAAHAPWGFRAVVFPGVVVFWPLFAARLLRLSRRSRQGKTGTRCRVEVLR